MDRRLLPLLVMVLLGGAVAAYAISWTDPTYAFYGSAGTGPIYFAHSFEATAGYWTGGCVVFSDFNLASAGVFGTIGFAADVGVSLTVQEVIPANRIVIDTAGVGGNFTVYMPTYMPVNVTTVTSWHFNSGFLDVTVPAGATTVTISFVNGGGTIFIIPQWFVNQGGAFFGVTNFFSQVLQVGGAFVAWFTSSVGYVAQLIYWVMTGVVGWGTFVITWFGRAIAFLTNFGSAMSGVWAQFSASSAPYAEIIALIFSADGLMLGFVIGFMSWFGSLPARAKRTGSDVFSILIGDLQKGIYIVEVMWNWSWTVFNFVFGLVMQFVSLLWGLIP